MSRVALTLAASLLLGPIAQAQDAADAPTDAAPAPPKAKARPPAAAGSTPSTTRTPKPAPVVAKPATPTPEEDFAKTLEERAMDEARRFFTGVLAGDARLLAGRAGYPFTLEAKRYDTPDALLPEWIRALRGIRSDLLTLYGIEIYTPEQMEAKYGKPPPRLAALPWKVSRAYIAVANLSGRAAIAVLRDSPNGMLVIGFTD